MVSLHPVKYRLALVLNTLFFPFTFPDVFEAFKGRDFTLGGGSPSSRVPVALGAQLYISGTIASKDGVIVDIDHDRRIVGAEGDDSDKLLKIFDEVLNVVQKDFHVDLDKKLDYVELSAAFLAKTEGVASENIEQFFAKTRRLEELKKSLGFEPAIRQFTLSQRGKPAETKDYVEFNVAPRLTSSDTYYIQAVFRHPHVPEVIGFTKTINEKVTFLIEAMEA